jgi:hypothetical protein
LRPAVIRLITLSDFVFFPFSIFFFLDLLVECVEIELTPISFVDKVLLFFLVVGSESGVKTWLA